MVIFASLRLYKTSGNAPQPFCCRVVSVTMAEESDTEAKVVPPQQTKARSSLPIKTLLVALLVLITVLALALGLGLGLGLGLKHHGNKSNSSPSAANSTSSSSEGPSLASFEVQPLRETTLNYSLDIPSWNFNAAPTTRTYNLILTESSGAPDGRRLQDNEESSTDFDRCQSDNAPDQRSISGAFDSAEPR